MSQRQERHLLVHYHIFKNAGSTLDAMLERQFAGRWANFDKPTAASVIKPEELADFIAGQPDLLAVSSHQAVLPLPQVPGVAITPALFLRHPLDRARSVYDFERRQGQLLGAVSKGAEHAARLSFADYLRWRFETGVNGVVHNFQTVRLIHHPRFGRQRIKDAEFNNAWTRLQALPFFGLVEQFDASIEMLGRILGRRGIRFATDYVAHNQSKREDNLPDRLERMRRELGEPAWQELLARNALDIRLYELAEREFAARQRAAVAG